MGNNQTSEKEEEQRRQAYYLQLEEQMLQKQRELEKAQTDKKRLEAEKHGQTRCVLDGKQDIVSQQSDSEQLGDDQQLEPVDRELILLHRVFEVSGRSKTIKGIQFEVVPERLNLQQFIENDVLYTALTSPKWNTQDKIEWLISAIYQLSYQPNNSLDYVDTPEGRIEKKPYLKLVHAVCSCLTTCILYPDAMEIKVGAEDVNNLADLSNQIATLLYKQLFLQNEHVNNSAPIEIYLDYLAVQADKEDATKILDMMCKRAFHDSKDFQINRNNSQLRALKMVRHIANYPSLIEPLILNSWIFLKQDVMKNGQAVQKQTIIGNILSASSFPNENPRYHQFIETQPNSTKQRLRDCRNVIKSSIEETKELFEQILENNNLIIPMLQYFSYLLQVNQNLEKNVLFNQFLIKQCSTYGFMFNFAQVLLSLFNNQMDSKARAKAVSASVDVGLLSYIKLRPIFSQIYQKIDQLNPELTPFYEPEELSTIPDLPTSLYLLIQRALSISTTVPQTYLEIKLHLHSLAQQFNSLEDACMRNPEAAQFYQVIQAYELHLLEPCSIERIIKFISFSASLAMNFIDINTLKAKYPYGLLPVSFLEVFHLYFGIYASANEFDSHAEHVETILEYLILSMTNKELIKNPHLRVRGIELFSILVPRVGNQSKHVKLAKVFDGNQIVQRYLMKGLLNVFIDSERTGSSTQFNDRFKYRFMFCSIFNHLLRKYPSIYSQQMLRLAKSEKMTFLSFANYYLNDVIYLLDECLQKMKLLIHLQQQLIQGNQARRLEYANLQTAFETISQYLIEYYRNIEVFSESEPEVFLTDEIRERLVNFMNYTLKELNEEEVSQFANRLLENSTFRPNEIIEKIVELYINFSYDQQFLEQIVQDERCFSLALLERTIQRLETQNLVSQAKIEKFREIADKLTIIQKDQAIIGCNVPEEFIDPLVNTIMRDPVKLPHSNVIIDRLTIKKQLLNSKLDPFDRTELTEEMLIEQPELKRRINEFLDEQRKKDLRAKQQQQRQSIGEGSHLLHQQINKVQQEEVEQQEIGSMMVQDEKVEKPQLQFQVNDEKCQKGCDTNQMDESSTANQEQQLELQFGGLQQSQQQNTNEQLQENPTNVEQENKEKFEHDEQNI